MPGSKPAVTVKKDFLEALGMVRVRLSCLVSLRAKEDRIRHAIHWLYRVILVSDMI